MTKILLAAGSGPSYSGWPHWPVWTKLLPLMFEIGCVDASGPAAGNKYLYRSVVTRWQQCQPDLVLMQWNFGKFDLYVENPKFIDQIINGTGVRNFLLDIHSGKTTQDAGYWCSSHDNTVEWKRQYNELVRTQRGTALDDLDAMISLQNLCAQKGIPYQFFCHDKVDHEYLSTDDHVGPFYNLVDWNQQVFPSVREMYEAHDSYQYRTDGIGHFHWVPNADWQYWFVAEKLAPIMAKLEVSPRPGWDKIKKYCHDKTLEVYQKYVVKADQ